MKAALSGGSIVHEKKRSVWDAPTRSWSPAIRASAAANRKNQRSGAITSPVMPPDRNPGCSPSGQSTPIRPPELAAEGNRSGLPTTGIRGNRSPSS
jgi:hypothetical protein